MKRAWVLGALALVAPYPGSAQQSPAPATAPAPAPRVAHPLTATQAVFDRYVAEAKIPGGVGAFGVGDAPTVFVAAGKIADGAGAPAAGPDSLWRIYSMTKPVTGMAAMLLVQDGKIALDDPVAKYFPGFATMRVLKSPDTALDSEPAKTQVTIRQLLTHTSGLGYNISAKGPILQEYERLGLLPGQVNVAMEDAAGRTRPRTLAAFAEAVAKVPLIHQPGTKWHYSIGLDVMGAVIEKASGMPFDAFVQTRILDPLKMTSTFWQVPAADAGRLATNYAIVAGNRAPLDPAATSVYLRKPAFPYGGAGLVSSARDYDRFLHMLQNGGTLDGATVMKPETARLAMSNLLPAGITFRADALPDVPMGFGAGGFVTLTDTPAGGKGTYGWDGAANTFAFVDPARKVRGVVMVNYFPFGVYPLRTDVLGALRQDAMRLHGK
ncbi:serine hydrolase [Sphingomonas sp. Leaf412]|uniref:serine hydrolase domain-containing protein n=1 Tax=Sphingomonas sp. Leaf412 TaxID=1736370 RepID=UPI000701FE2F|nr:serine hydrolase domain-containing protein [Sphingomonas sp. Leaf412]KQT31809.1 serine hydrolase [Sphingomonas sp. Leaf412]